MGSTSSPFGIQGLAPQEALIRPALTHVLGMHISSTLTLILASLGHPGHRVAGGRKPLGSAFCCKARNVSGWLEKRRNLAMTSQTVFSHPNYNALTTPPDPLVHPLAGTHIHLAVNSALLL
ncbi:uncharacterized protein FSUBG_6439 [Fusarium subglutinans]|uniref:Uncharacterized protein n=1 Tax=Gibberella subglutinans TaxID=42677 RepID=A0A8H5PZN8_GIBSU|nr:uncharacterized protein FSUBG_6439 [Fusarium subglutinans]KAF5605518.1 hypothetical protein FSUBG_6439 [Fusarium subglutinans]